MGRNRYAIMLAWAPLGVLTSIATSPALARDADRHIWHLPAQSLADALHAISVTSGRAIAAPAALVADKTSAALDGEHTTLEAINDLLAGTGLRVRAVGQGFIIEPDAPPAPDASPGTDIVVTGTRIRGAPVASPIVRLSNDDIRNAGQSTVAEAVRTIPQNFGGGQNPGVGFNVPASNGVNVGNTTSINLRGLGSDATLTLLNGHRLSYSASRQAIDVSSIPLGAVDRIEIVPDGASALYGSDAVAGVANIVLRSDYSGVETSARLGTSTDGGDFEQRYGIVAGARWTSGGVIAAYEFGRTTAIEGRDRSYTALAQPSLTLLPGMRNHSATISAHQDITPTLRLEVDALYNNRFSETAYSLSPTGDITASGARFAYTSKSFVVAPTLRLTLGRDWRMFLTGSYGQDHTLYDVTSYAPGRVVSTPNNCYCNDATSVELGGDGTLLRLGASSVRLALGVGYRTNDFVRFNGTGATTNIARQQDSYYGYSELSIPVVSQAEQVPWIDRLSLNGALRYERYPGIGEIATPKVGIVYAPTGDFDLKGSWGKSYRAPTLYQEYQARNVVVAPPSAFGGTGYAAGATAILLQGGNPALRPERATTWSGTIDIHPRALDGAKLQLSYFSTDYRDRIVTPIAFLGQALSNPFYADRLTANPNRVFLADIIASAVSFGNATGAPYDPATVAVFIDSQNVNAGRQSIRGADALLTYRARLAGDSWLGATLNATYLESDQQLGTGKPVIRLAGIIFNPPHVRARGGVTWEGGGFHLTSFLNYTGGVEDTRTPATVRVASITTLDLSARYRTGAGHGILANLDLVVSIQNVSNAKPARIATTLLYDAPFDSTNQSAVGRFVSLLIAKKW